MRSVQLRPFYDAEFLRSASASPRNELFDTIDPKQTLIAHTVRIGAEWALAYEMPVSAWAPIASMLPVHAYRELR
jgi:hypothetical protein